METFEAIKSRRSIRKFKPKEVPRDLIDKIIDAGTWAPSGINMQPWEFIVVTDKEQKEKLMGAYIGARKERKVYTQNYDLLKNAVFIICCNDTKRRQEDISVSMAMQNMLLAATELGLGSLVATAFVSTENSRKKVREILKVPEHIEVVGFVLIGYADEQPEPKPKRSKSEIVHFNSYG